MDPASGGATPEPLPIEPVPVAPPRRGGSAWAWVAASAVGAIVLLAALPVFLPGGGGEPSPAFPLRDIHWHAEVEVTVSGRPASLGPVPAGHPFVGLPWLHHHGDGTAHIESSNFPGGAFTRPEQISLGAFFDAIGVLLTREQVCLPDGSGCANGRKFRVEVFVNGARKPDFRNYTLRDGDLIQVRAE